MRALKIHSIYKQNQVRKTTNHKLYKKEFLDLFIHTEIILLRKNKQARIVFYQSIVTFFF